MRGGLRSACSLVIVLALAGCAGSSWQFWKTSESAEAPADPTLASAPPAEATAAPAPAPTATPAPTVDPTPVEPTPSSNGYTELPGLADVRFRSGQVGLVKADRKILDTLVRWLKENPGSVVMIEGHTDDLGTRESNLAVGEKRAASVMRYLISRGLEPARVSATSVGSDRPACTEKTDSCRAKNRRARFLVKQP
jgi:outer membrane protein OmpA-like peptidoglycan-associated protein